jgi:hypothetical protein
MQRLQADGVTAPLPPLPVAGAHLVAHLFEVGPTGSTGMGAGPVQWTELQAWQEQIGVALHPWEARTLRRLSMDYAAEAHRASSPTAAPPWAQRTTEEQRRSVADRIRKQMAAERLAAEHSAAAETAARRTARR